MVESATATTGSTVSPNDSAAALRLGWILAEARGRLAPAANQSVDPTPAPPVLLLDAANERSDVERQVESVKVLATLSAGGTSDMQLHVLSFDLKWANDDAAVTGLTASGMVRYLASRLIWSRTGKDLSGTLGASPIIIQKPDEKASDAPPDPTAADWWDRFASFLWAWDEAIQDQFATQTFGTASSYELGRGLAESYWALVPSSPADGPSNWGFLLSANRVEALTDLCKRLGPVIGTITAGAVEKTIDSWGDVAKELLQHPRAYPDAQDQLRLQMLVWRDLLVTGRDPVTMVDSKDLEKVARRPWPLVQAFGWEIGLTVVGAALIGLGAAYFSKFSAAFLSVLGALGITASALVAWAKNNVQKVADRVRAAVSLDAVVQAVLKVPKGFPPKQPRRG
ncbi:MAG TPA: hypothetical protein VHS57_09260 [Acidimicrobiales bacterium]|nr:hypothetical protein [Acidimicrobiales bacterium]